MNSGTAPQGQNGPVKRTSFSSFPAGSASMFLDRSKAGIRGSTPDSEALASSDDEQDHYHRLHPVTSNPGPKSGRRPSWTPQAPVRKGSLGGHGPFSPVSPNSAAPSSDQVPWGGGASSTTGSVVGRGHSASTSFPWGSTIWNNDSQKGPPQRLTEVLPSPTSMVPPGSAGLYAGEPIRSPSTGQENLAESAIPFAIPLQPTPKTYRSQSYSVGQLDPESSNMSPGPYGGYGAYGRSRNGMPYTGLQHRPSRPSMLGDVQHDTKLLGQLQEVDDDEESLRESDPDIDATAKSQARTIEQLAMENAMLRQAAMEQMERETARNRDPGFMSSSSKSARQMKQNLQHTIHDRISGGADYSIYDVEDADFGRTYRHDSSSERRSSEYTTKSIAQHTVSGNTENRAFEGMKKGHWQSSLGFGGIVEPPQSRRHSFADVPTRQNSIGSASDHNSPVSHAEIGLGLNGRQAASEIHGESFARPSQSDALAYHARAGTSMLQGVESREVLPSSATLRQAYVQNQFGRSHNLGHTTRPNQLLYMVTFKAQRADVFYVQEGTGLQVRKGDLVIVEADRGADLGTVASESVPFAEAKEMKEKLMQEHFQWLMVFSRHGQNGTVAGPNPNGQPPGSNGTTGSMGGSSIQNGVQDIPTTELKPKMIKRLAQPHEVQTLRDKEGNEAKAKRVCQQKVVEHRLNMEILEAEFQMDWKKLTFYYFADEYINFNSLVTDLFKIYKTRIWMSAINPASFQTPIGGIQIPGSIGASAQNSLSSDVDQHTSRRQQRQQQVSTPVGLPHSALNGYDNSWSQGRDSNAVNNLAFQQLYGQPFFRQEIDLRQPDHYPPDYRQNAQQVLNMHSPFAAAGYSTPGLHHASSFNSRPDSSSGGPPSSQGVGRDWSHSFQGLSLGP